MAQDETISTLNDLIETCRDGEEGFRTAAQNITDSNLKRVFQTYSQQRAAFASELERLVSAYGEEPEESSSTAGAMHRGWIKVKSSLQEAMGRNDAAAVLAECERGEDSAVEQYKEALEKPLPPEAASVVENQYSSVRAAHDRIRDLRDAAQGA